ncbi:hypothetical protein Glove_198g42 [Diversispora epigaea]|uniref:Uncharacterized protein n=1 Tax=Diversispora epigaea TaxID=1348612 RepID=A0A397ITX0_9GLOM|nr:hypothetical protein Glove_198g43 [Diversispora epigaea]RHZ76394.1 hypothetical protein Glove_198g42 [Diversispora epigaea]
MDNPLFLLSSVVVSVQEKENCSCKRNLDENPDNEAGPSAKKNKMSLDFLMK